MKPTTNKNICEYCKKEIKYISASIGAKPISIPMSCECVLQAKNKERADFLKKQDKIKRLKILNKFEIGERVSRCSFDNWDQSQEKTKVLFDASKKYTNDFIENKKLGLGLFLSGGVGIGKTHLSFAITKELFDKGYTCLFVTATQLLDYMQSLMGFKNEKEDILDFLKFLCNIDVLVIDDIGSHKWTETKEENLFKVIDGRYANLKPVIVNSNKSAEVTNTLLGARVYDRLVGSCISVSCSAKSYRYLDLTNQIKTKGVSEN